MLRLFSPAKVNLFLLVVGKRPDGYHDLASLFQTITLGDTLEYELSDKDVLTCTDPTLPTDASNLVLKAASLFRSKTGIKIGLKINLDKKIPSQAGLGGGSSNAASTLWAFNKLTGCPASVKELQQWGGEIGSDVPFFFSEGTALCEGRGEKVHPLPSLESAPFWIAKPKSGCSTPAVFKRLRLDEMHQPQLVIENLLDPISYHNDLEIPAFEINPELKKLKEILLKSGFQTVLMTGSGSAFFCMGSLSSFPSIPDVSYYAVQFLNRKSDDWYRI